MKDRHPDHRTLERFLAGDLPGDQSRVLERHVLTCRRCEERLQGILPRPGLETLFTLLQSAARPREAPARTGGSAGWPDLTRERADAARLWEALEGRDAEARERGVAEEAAFCTWGLFELLVDRSRDVLPENPREAEPLARLALAVASRLDAEIYGASAVHAALVKAWTHVANALRVVGDFRQAEAAFENAEGHLALSWLDPLDEALVLELKGAMRRAQGRHAEALELIDDAIALYQEVNEPHRHGRALIVKGLTLQYQGDPEGAARCFRESLLLLDGAREPRLLLMSQCNLIGCLNESGCAAEAAPLLPAAWALAEQVGRRSDRLRLAWIEGRVQASQGRWGEAEATFEGIRESFAQDGLRLDAALVGLDLAAVYVRQAKTAEARSLAAGMLAVFRGSDVHREALAALIVFEQAAQKERLTERLIRAVSSFLEKSRDNPELRFAEPA